MNQSGRASSLLIIAVVLALGAATKERRALNEALSEDAAQLDRVQHLSVYAKALLWQLNQVTLDSPFLIAEGVEGSGSDEVSIEESGNSILYFLSPKCPICPTNYELLNDLADSGVPVFGLVFDPEPGAVGRHRSEWDPRFPILVDPKGSAVGIVPRYGTPTTVVVSGGEVVFLEFGELEPQTQGLLRSITESWGLTGPGSAVENDFRFPDPAQEERGGGTPSFPTR